MARKQMVVVKFKKRTLRVPAETRDCQHEPDISKERCATCKCTTLKLIEVVTQRGMWFDEYLWLCYCPKCEAATILRVYEDKFDDDQQ